MSKLTFYLLPRTSFRCSRVNAFSLHADYQNQYVKASRTLSGVIDTKHVSVFIESFPMAASIPFIQCSSSIYETRRASSSSMIFVGSSLARYNRYRFVDKKYRLSWGTLCIRRYFIRRNRATRDRNISIRSAIRFSRRARLSSAHKGNTWYSLTYRCVVLCREYVEPVLLYRPCTPDEISSLLSTHLRRQIRPESPISVGPMAATKWSAECFNFQHQPITVGCAERV